jgi:hypothetical protein
MPIHRWATYSVRDHNHPDSFVADVLLYDRLFVPVPPENEPAEYDRWTDSQWNPGLLLARLKIIDDLVERIPWDKRLREMWDDGWETAKLVGQDAFATTRWVILSQVPQGDLVRPVVAYESDAEFQQDVHVNPEGVQDRVDRLAIAFRHRFLIPDNSMSHVERLHRAADMARDPEFQEARAALYQWQEDMIMRGYSDRQALAEMEELLAKYERVQRGAKWQPVVRYGLFAASLIVPGVKELGLLKAWTSYGFEAAIKTAELVHGHQESKVPGCLAPAATIHTLQKDLGLRRPKTGSATQA